MGAYTHRKFHYPAGSNLNIEVDLLLFSRRTPNSAKCQPIEDGIASTPGNSSAACVTDVTIV